MLLYDPTPRGRKRRVGRGWEVTVPASLEEQERLFSPPPQLYSVGKPNTSSRNMGVKIGLISVTEVHSVSQTASNSCPSVSCRSGHKRSSHCSLVVCTQQLLVTDLILCTGPMCVFTLVHPLSCVFLQMLQEKERFIQNHMLTI